MKKTNTHGLDLIYETIGFKFFTPTFCSSPRNP